MNKNSKEPRSTEHGESRVYRQRKKHRDLFTDELRQEMAMEERSRRQSVPAVSKPGNAKPKTARGFFRTAKIVAKILMEEAFDFVKRLTARRSAKTVITTALICAVGLTAIISVAAAASRMDEPAADAILAPDADGKVAADNHVPSEGEDRPQTNNPAVKDDPNSAADTEDVPSGETEASTASDETESGTDPAGTDAAETDSSETEPSETEPSETEPAETDSAGTDSVGTESAAESDDSDPDGADIGTESGESAKEDTNTITVSFWDKESVTYESDAKTVGEFITRSGVELSAAQLANIDTSLPIGGDITIAADVVTYDKEVVEEILEFDTEYRESPYLEAGVTEITQYGANGSQSREFTVTYVNGVEVDRYQSASWIDSSPTAQIVTTGTGAGINYPADSDEPDDAPGESAPTESGNTFIGADGVEREYLYYIDVQATCYYVGGTTASGLPADETVIAVDPSVIPLGTQVYVMGSYGDFGVRIAADTGGNIKGNVIDICIDPSDPRAGSFGWRSMRVYFLA